MARRDDKVASRYAKALYELLKTEKKINDVVTQLEPLGRAIEGHKELDLVFRTSLFSDSARNGIVEDLIQAAKLSEDAKKVMILLAKQGRLDHLSRILEKLQLLVLEKASIVPLQVESASELSTTDKEKLAKKFEKLLGRKVEARFYLEPALLGGLRVTAAGRTFDGSITGLLAAFRESVAV